MEMTCDSFKSHSGNEFAEILCFYSLKNINNSFAIALKYKK